MRERTIKELGNIIPYDNLEKEMIRAYQSIVYTPHEARYVATVRWTC